MSAADFLFGWDDLNGQPNGLQAQVVTAAAISGPSVLERVRLSATLKGAG